MGFAPDQLSDDRFLDGKLNIYQPVDGYRAATDPVFLAAGVPAKSGQSVLELGCGAGVAIGCLCARVSGLDAAALELQPDYADLARQNMARNRLSVQVLTGDLAAPPDAIKSRSFDHVLMNPPFFRDTSVTPPHDKGRQTAHVEQLGLEGWIHAGLRRLRAGGWLSIIHLAERLPDLLAPLDQKAGNIHVLPLSSRTGRPAKRVIILAQKGAKAPLTLLAPLVIHHGEAHVQGQSDYSEIARQVLRAGGPLPILERI